jgi:ribonuclease R
MRRLDDYYVHEEDRHALIGRNSGHVYRLGDNIRVRLDEVNVVTGSLSLTVVSHATDGSGTIKLRPEKAKRGNKGRKYHRRR